MHEVAIYRADGAGPLLIDKAMVMFCPRIGDTIETLYVRGTVTMVVHVAFPNAETHVYL